jgi:hypothetical protein
MYVCMYVCMYACLHMYLHTCIYIIHMNLGVPQFTWNRAHGHSCMYVCMHIHTYAHNTYEFGCRSNTRRSSKANSMPCKHSLTQRYILTIFLEIECELAIYTPEKKELSRVHFFSMGLLGWIITLECRKSWLWEKFFGSCMFRGWFECMHAGVVVCMCMLCMRVRKRHGMYLAGLVFLRDWKCKMIWMAARPGFSALVYDFSVTQRQSASHGYHVCMLHFQMVGISHIRGVKNDIVN